MNLLYLTILFPVLGFLILALGRARLSENISALVGVGSMAASAGVAGWVGYNFLHQAVPGTPYSETLWTWMQVGNFAPHMGLYLDRLSLVMLGVVTGVGTLIHLFASWYMRGEEGYERFFSYMNLFVGAMLLLVLGDNLLALYFGWEGVGLCSFLLIGFYYKDPANGLAARKAFVVTRVGDVFMAIGLFTLYREVGTLDIQGAMQLALHTSMATGAIGFITLMLLGGAVGKSAQLPLHTWLADAMAGPTPVSALIHAATMVTAGVYLIARTHVLFQLAPDVLHLVGVVGEVTLLVAGFGALAQTDIKRILAYSTMSQIGYMFLALGAGAWGAAIFHLMTHAFFKALLFLSAGAVIIATHHEQNIFKMGGLYKKIPLVYACFLIGGGALAAVPFLTVGFYSKDEILVQAALNGHPDFVLAGLAGAFLTSIYTFRLIFIVFHGKENGHADPIKGISYWLPLTVLLVLSTGAGALLHPEFGDALPAAPAINEAVERHIQLLSGGIALLGIAIAALLFLGERRLVRAWSASAPGKLLSHASLNALYWDYLYDWVFVRPFMLIVRANAGDVVDQGIGLIPRLLRAGNRLMSFTENGQVRWYAASVAIGAVAVLAVLILV